MQRNADVRCDVDDSADVDPVVPNQRADVLCTLAEKSGPTQPQHDDLGVDPRCIGTKVHPERLVDDRARLDRGDDQTPHPVSGSDDPDEAVLTTLRYLGDLAGNDRIVLDVDGGSSSTLPSGDAEPGRDITPQHLLKWWRRNALVPHHVALELHQRLTHPDHRKAELPSYDRHRSVLDEQRMDLRLLRGDVRLSFRVFRQWDEVLPLRSRASAHRQAVRRHGRRWHDRM
ncbi:hypothetical protein [Sphingomonas sp. 22R3R2A-7]|uniref:hypothetical protein n=1 Tax=Sphingomonas sp. 22R3R2A-7 TaxID=3050230 RepID=UPI002FE05D9F